MDIAKIRKKIKEGKEEKGKSQVASTGEESPEVAPSPEEADIRRSEEKPVTKESSVVHEQQDETEEASSHETISLPARSGIK